MLSASIFWTKTTGHRYWTNTSATNPQTSRFFQKKNKTASEEQSFTKDVLVFCNLGGVKSQMHTKFYCLDFGHKSDNCQLCIFYQTGYDVEGKAYEVPSVGYMYVLVLLQP